MRGGLVTEGTVWFDDVSTVVITTLRILLMGDHQMVIFFAYVRTPHGCGVSWFRPDTVKFTDSVVVRAEPAEGASQSVEVRAEPAEGANQSAYSLSALRFWLPHVASRRGLPRVAMA